MIKRLLMASGSAPAFFGRNLWCARKTGSFPAAGFGAFVVEPLSRKYLAAVDDLYAALNGGTRLGLRQLALLWMLGSRLCIVAREAGRDQIVGVTIFYFNTRDRKEKTVHAAYNGMHEKAQGVGLGTFMLRHGLEHFARSGLAGASSRVSIANLPALKTNEKAGFVPIETHPGPSTGEAHHYLVCDLSRYKEWAPKS